MKFFWEVGRVTNDKRLDFVDDTDHVADPGIFATVA